MPPRSTKFGGLLLMGALAVAPWALAQANPMAQTATPTTAPPRPEQMPAVAPRVSYSNGQLTVLAANSTLADILKSIHNATGVRIETSGGYSSERVAAKIGPATVREVLLSLLEGSSYDYIILGALENPEKVERVILTASSGGNAQSIGPVGRQTQATPEYQPAMPVSEGDEEDNQDGFATPSPQPPQPVDEQDTEEELQQKPTPQSTSPTPKTPEQILEEMQRLEQQKQQQLQPGQPPPGRQRTPRPR